MNLKTLSHLRHSFALIALFVISAAGVASAQTVYTRPSSVPQPIQVQPQPSPSPFIKNTVKMDAARPDVVPGSLEPFVSGTRGVLVETMDGKQVMDVASNQAFNPASNVKVITALAVLKTLKPTYRFPTKLYTDGVYNTQTGEIYGNLYVIGGDPSFNQEHGVELAAALNQLGVRQIKGDLIVSPSFTLGYNPSARASAATLKTAMDGGKRSPAATNAYQALLNVNRQTATNYPSVVITGNATSEDLPTNLRLLVTHESSPLKDILKACLSFSNNFIAERLGDAVGGSFRVAQIAQQEAKVDPSELYIASSSGLGVNRVTPRAMMKVFRALHNELAKNKMSITDILPVAGVDQGTLHNRFTDYNSQASVIGKTGTLPQTDGGVSSLVGQAGTAKGDILFFVIFNMRGNVNSFRAYQNNLVAYLQNQRGGAMSFKYLPVSFATLLANTRTKIEKQ